MREDVWIGLFEVAPQPGNDLLEGGVGAFVNVIGIAISEPDFVRRVTFELSSYQFNILQAKDIELLSERRAHGVISDELLARSSEVSDDTPIMFGEFNSYGDVS